MVMLVIKKENFLEYANFKYLRVIKNTNYASRKLLRFQRFHNI